MPLDELGIPEPCHLIDPTRSMAGTYGVPVYCSEEPQKIDGTQHASHRIDDVDCIDCIKALQTGGVRQAKAGQS